MKLTKEQIEALAAGVDYATVVAMATTAPSGDPKQEEIDAIEALTSSLGTANAEKEALTTQLATVTAEIETLKAQLAEQVTASEAAASDAATLRGIVENQITQLSVAVGSKFDAKELDAAGLVAKHAEMTAAVKDKFKNVSIAASKPGVQSEDKDNKPVISPTRLAKAKQFKIAD